MLKVGWIGLGNMGIPMTKRIIKAGFSLYVYNRSPEKITLLTEMGAYRCLTPREVVEKCDVVVTMLADISALLNVFMGEEGILAGMIPGKTMVDMSTIHPDDSILMASQIAKQGAAFVDAPVSGSVKPAEDGMLVILAGGKRDDVNLCTPIFDVLGKNVIHFGDIGSGNKAKLVINLLLGITMQGISESLALAQNLGLERRQVLQMIGESAVATPILKLKENLFMTESFPAAFPLKWMSKDLSLVMEVLGEHKSLPLAAVAAKTYEAARQIGLGEMDVSAILLEVTGTFYEK